MLPADSWSWLTVELKSHVDLATNLDVDDRLWHGALLEAWCNVSVFDLNSLSSLNSLGQALFVLSSHSEHPLASSLQVWNSAAEYRSTE